MAYRQPFLFASIIGPRFLVSQAGVYMDDLTYDIFRGAIGSGQEIWLEAVSGLLKAHHRMEQIAAKSPGLYFLFDVHHHIVVGSADTRTSAKPSSASKAKSA